ncbi:MAG: hypothetical protein ACRDK2_17280 [Solirubrobacteraceae bacterium]
MNPSLTSHTPSDVGASGPTTADGSAGNQQPLSASAPERTCSRCGGTMVAAQDWCLHCGAGAPQAIHPRPRWRSLVSVAVIALLLAVGAAAAAYAALNEKSPPRRTVVASAPVVTTSVPTTPPPAIPSTPQTTSTPSIPEATPSIPEPSTPPKIPLEAPTPSTPQTTSSASKEPTKTSTQEKPGTGTSNTKEVAPVVLDTNAASIYNPNNYPATDFGEPELAIDGDPTTAWTAAVQPESAPQMAAGLLIDLKSPQKLSKFTLISPSKGMTIEFYGTDAMQPPTTITDKSWVKFVRARVIKKAKTKIILRKPSKAFRFVLLWLIKAPPNSTPTEPGQVKVDELTLFPAS